MKYPPRSSFKRLDTHKLLVKWEGGGALLGFISIIVLLTAQNIPVLVCLALNYHVCLHITSLPHPLLVTLVCDPELSPGLAFK